MTDTPLQLEYAHCVKATLGKPNHAPWTLYRRKTVNVMLHRQEWEESEDDFLIVANGQTLGYGDTPQEAIDDATYWLMEKSRDEAYHMAETKLQAMEGMIQNDFARR